MINEKIDALIAQSIKDRKTQENNHKRQAEIDKQIEELKSDLKVVKDYFSNITLQDVMDN